MKRGLLPVLLSVAGTAAGYRVASYREKKKTKIQKEYADKHLQLYLMMNQWVQVKQEGKSIADYLDKEGYKNVAIYGMNYVGETLLREFTGTDISVKYGIDRKAETICSDIKVVVPDDDLENVDAVIVTAITVYDEIEEYLSEKIDCPILSLEGILYEL